MMTEPNCRPISSELMNKTQAFVAVPDGTEFHPDGENWRVKFPDGYVAVDWDDFEKQLRKRIPKSN